MKTIFALCVVFLISTFAFASDIKTGEDLITAMHKKYGGKWYKTLTFKQKTITHKPDGTSDSAIWYEALNAPGRLRIDFEPLDKHDGLIFADGKIFSFKDGTTNGGRAFVHPLLVLGFDVYHQSTDTTVTQLKGMGIDLSTIHEEKWQGRDAYVVGAKAGDMTKPQFWIDKKNLYFVRLIQLVGKDKKAVAETQFNKYYKAGGGWVSPEVPFFIDGKPTTTEEYSDIKTGMTLSEDLWKSDKWLTADRDYWKKK